MAVAPSCPILLVHDDDAYRRALIKALDERHFSVTYTADEGEALRAIGEKPFQVIVVASERTKVVDYLRSNGDGVGAAVIVIGEARPELRTLAAFADETLLKPVDAGYVAERARTYCRS